MLEGELIEVRSRAPPALLLAVVPLAMSIVTSGRTIFAPAAF